MPSAPFNRLSPLIGDAAARAAVRAAAFQLIAINVGMLIVIPLFIWWRLGGPPVLSIPLSIALVVALLTQVSSWANTRVCAREAGRHVADGRDSPVRVRAGGLNPDVWKRRIDEAVATPHDPR